MVTNRYAFPLVASLAATLLTGLSWPVSESSAAQVQAQSPKHEFRSVWLSTYGGQDWPPGTPDPALQQEVLLNTIRNTRRLGLNAFTFQAVAGGDAFYESDRIPWSVYLSGGPNTGTAGKNPGWDPLAVAVEEAHRTGMEIHAGMDVFYAGSEHSITNPESSPPHIMDIHSGWIETLDDGSKWINPAFPQAREWILGNVLDIIGRYDVDGILMASVQYANEYSRDDSLMQLYNPAGHENIGDWRRGNITMLVRDIYDAVKEIKPWVKVGSISTGHYRASGGWAATFGYSNFYQDSRSWAGDAVIDYIVPQLFWSIGSQHAKTAFVQKKPAFVTVSEGPAYNGNDMPTRSNDMSTRYNSFSTASTASGNPVRLQLPARKPDAKTGSAFVDQIRNMPLSTREDAIVQEVVNGNIPAFLRDLVPVTVTHGSNEVIFYITADYLAIGDDEDAFITPLTPVAGQKIADFLDCSLPTRKIVDLVWTAAPLKLAPQPIPPSNEMTTVPVFAEHNEMISAQRKAVILEHPPGTLVAGTKKDVIISNRYNNYSTPRVIIYGWHQLNGTPIQPVSGVHRDTYVDYSHGIRLVSRNVLVNGEPGRLEDILKDAHFAPLVSDEGVVDFLRYPVPLPNFGWLIDEWMNDVRGRHYYPGTGPFRLDIKRELGVQIDLIRDSQAPGHMHFSYRAIADDPFNNRYRINIVAGLPANHYWNSNADGSNDNRFGIADVLDPFDNRYRNRSIVPPMPWLSMRTPNRVRNLGGMTEGRNVTLTWDPPEPGRGETSPFFRYVVYREKENRIITDQTVIDDPAAIIAITGETSFTDTPPAAGTENFVYYVTALSRNNVEGDFQKSSFEIVSTDENHLKAHSLQLHQNYPNPFNPSTIIRYTIPEHTHVRLDVFCVSGRRVAILEDSDKPSGSHEITLEAPDWAGGIYFYRLVTQGRTLVRRMTVVK